MNGIEFLKKRRDLLLDVPVVILSSVATEGASVTMQAIELGASDFITKLQSSKQYGTGKKTKKQNHKML